MRSMRRRFIVLVSLSLLIVGGALVAWLDPGLAKDPPPLAFTVDPSASTYDLSDSSLFPVVLLTLRNISTSPVTVYASAIGTVSLTVTKDRQRVRPSTLSGFSLVPMTAPRRELLVTLSPGESAPIPLDTFPLVDTPGWFLLSFHKGSPLPKARRYLLTEPGVYTLRIRYQYRGPDYGLATVYHKQLTGETRFTVR